MSIRLKARIAVPLQAVCHHALKGLSSNFDTHRQNVPWEISQSAEKPCVFLAVFVQVNLIEPILQIYNG